MSTLPDVAPRCLRCVSSELEPTDDGPGVSFWVCPSCRRRFTMHEDGVLTERWLGPLSLVLYDVIFARDPLTRVAGAAARIPPGRVQATVAEIDLELAAPTQPVSRILGPMAAGERELREYLGELATVIRDRSGPESETD